MSRIFKLLLWAFILALIAVTAVWLLTSRRANTGQRDFRVLDWIKNPQDHPDWAVKAGQRCGQAPFQLPTDGFIGYLWDDSFRPGHRHQGIDIFGGGQPGDTPVTAAASGFLTRNSDWKSSVIIRIPEDPLHPGQQIWTYYTHMADAEGNSLIASNFPPGTEEYPIEAGTLLGYQGNFSGTPGQPVGVHLHFSIVVDDGQGKFKNELLIANTLDPSPYLGIELSAHRSSGEIPLCP